MNAYLILKWLHVLSSTVLFGTGLGIAYFMLRAHLDGRVPVIAAVAGTVVKADAFFTATAVIMQPVTGVWLALHVGYPLTEPWLLASIVLYVLIGACWLPVVWLQLRLRDMTRQAEASAALLPDRYSRYFRWWFALGWPAFLGVMLVFYLMIAKPPLWGG